MNENVMIYKEDTTCYAENKRYSDADIEKIFENPREFIQGYESNLSGKTSSYHHKWNDTPNPEGSVNPAARMQAIIDAQWTDCPVEVENIIKQLWRLYELGNDRYILKTNINDLLDTWVNGSRVRDYRNGEWGYYEIDTRPLIKYIMESFPEHDSEDSVWIHWWW